jgi:hypothetical protein
MDRNVKIATGVLTALLVLSTFGIIYYWDKSGELTLERNRAGQRADSLVAVKSRLEAGIRELENELASIKEDTDSLTEQVTDINGLLGRREAALRRIQAVNAQLAAYRDTAQTQLSGLQHDRDRLTGENQSLVDQSNALREEVAGLNEKLRVMVPRSAVTADAFRVEARKRNEKATAKAKKVHTLTVSFHVPPVLRTDGEQEVYLSLTNLQDNVQFTPLRTAVLPGSGAGQTLPVHAVERVRFDQDLQRISFTLQPTDDLKPGTYRASVFTGDTYLGAVEFPFRDSFWFF